MATIVTIPFQFRSIITFGNVAADSHQEAMSQSLFNSGLLLLSKSGPTRGLWSPLCHNPFSIQVYYYKSYQRSRISNLCQSHNPFSIQVYYYDTKKEQEKEWEKGVTIPFQFRSIITQIKREERELERNHVTIPFQFRSIITVCIRRIIWKLSVESQSLFNSGLLLPYSDSMITKEHFTMSQSLFNSGLLLLRSTVQCRTKYG